MKHKSVPGAVNRLRVYSGYISCACVPERPMCKTNMSHDRTCARGDFLESVRELRRLLRKRGWRA